jgi:hypothetical protein
LACGGEGMTWRSKQIWHLETIEQRKILIMAEKSKARLRDDSGRKIQSGSEFDDSTIGIYLECK